MQGVSLREIFIMLRFFITFFLVCILAVRVESACQLDEADFGKYAKAHQRVSLWSLSVILKGRDNLMRVDKVNLYNEVSSGVLLRNFGEFESYVRSGIKKDFSDYQLESFGLNKSIPKSVARDLIYICRIEEFVPNIKTLELSCNTPSSKQCSESVVSILKKFNIISKGVRLNKRELSREHCDI